jgi:hypothetical protein
MKAYDQLKIDLGKVTGVGRYDKPLTKKQKQEADKDYDELMEKLDSAPEEEGGE